MKRGLLHIAICVSLWGASMASCAQNLVVDVEGGQIEGVIDQEGIVAVSYTHLTLPTKA